MQRTLRGWHSAASFHLQRLLSGLLARFVGTHHHLVDDGVFVCEWPMKCNAAAATCCGHREIAIVFVFANMGATNVRACIVVFRYRVCVTHSFQIRLECGTTAKQSHTPHHSLFVINVCKRNVGYRWMETIISLYFRAEFECTISVVGVDRPTGSCLWHMIVCKQAWFTHVGSRAVTIH